ILPPTPKPSFSPVVLACPLAYRSPSGLGATVSKRFAPDHSTTHAAQRKARLRREQERILRDSGPSIPRTRQAILFAVKRTPKSRFVAPLFSWSYELLFPQLFYFDNHLRCPRGVGSALCSRSALCARLCWRSSLTPFAATHTKSPPASPFAATHTKKGGWGQITVNLRQASTIRRANLQRLRALLN